VALGKSLSGKAAAAVALVSIKDNQAAWLAALDKVFGGAVRIEDVFGLLGAVLATQRRGLGLTPF
jgi:hypothetical protein